ncbi:PilZ domain-containing protein [Rheinheimera texasensis]|uniref:PilZ domain-containing protein n=1 Tax=Rheinheimera texasensis TaxID=306205 RepID=UPI0032B28F62
MDHRKFSRILYNNQATLRFQGQNFFTQVLDLSLKGALVQRPTDFQGLVGEQAQLQFQLDQSELVLEMDVSIAHLHDATIGLRCERIDIESASHLRRLLELNLGDAEMLSRELSELSN